MIQPTLARAVVIGSILVVLCLSTMLALSAGPTHAQGVPPRPTLTPMSTREPERDETSLSANIEWSQAHSYAEGLSTQPMLVVTVRGVNAGGTTSASDAHLSYDPSVLRLLDVIPTRALDWVRERDAAAGLLAIALGQLEPSEQAIMHARFLVLRPVTTTIRLVRADGMDRANPLFLDLKTPSVAPIGLTWQRSDAGITIVGRGYKPGEHLALWANTRQSHVVAIEGNFTASQDDDGSINVVVSSPDQDVASIIVYGRISGVTGMVNVVP